MSKNKEDRRHCPCVSFVMPAYNSAETIEESVESIFDGNYQDGDEVIIVNDKSTDDTLACIKLLQSKYPAVKLIDNSVNIGAPASRNIGIEETSNDYIFNLDSDDILVRGSRFDLEDYLLDECADIAVFGESHFFQTNKEEITHIWIFKPGIMRLSDLLAGSKAPGQNCLYTKESWRKIGKYWEYGKGLLEDWGFFLNQLVNGSKFVVLPGKFYYHRYGRNSLFVRENNKGNNVLSEMASTMISPFLHLLEPDDVEMIIGENGCKSWFTNLDKYPVRVKGMPVGERYKVKYNYFTIIKVYTKKYICRIFKKDK